MKPISIRLFSNLYLASIGLYALNAIVFWSRLRELAGSSPQVQANPAMGGMVTGILAGTLVGTTAISLLFWWLVMRRADAGKWLVIITEAIGALAGLWSLLQLARGTAPLMASGIVGLVATALAVAAAVTLLRPDAADWFRASDAADAPFR